MKDILIFSNLRICTEDGILENANVIVENRVIQSITTKINPALLSSAQVFQFPENFTLAPGFIDMHVHGANGADVMDATPEALSVLSHALAAEGVTGFLATTMTASVEQIEKTLCAVRDFMCSRKDKKGAEILGVHLEGPFLSPKKVGAQRADKLLEPNIKYIKQWQALASGVIKLVTLAPELPNSLEFIKQLQQEKIIASIGHTDATFAETQAAIEAGCSHVTHLFNSMRGMHQREPGAVTAALMSDQVIAELIVDGVHVHPSLVDLVLKLKKEKRIALVTDSMRAKCLQDGFYELGGQTVEVKNKAARLSDGTLAGSVLTMTSAMQNMMKFTGCDLLSVVKMAAENPAKELGLFDKKGSIAEDKDADLVVLDDTLQVVLTVCGGRVVFQKNASFAEATK
jgi:N-acetylglucosamine-6-phosphate deacetylase